MPNMKPLAIGKPYIINMVGDNDAEINLYGEVVATHPTDWWTGEKLPGNYIAQDEFLKDLDELATKDNITVHINSVGGDMDAGLTIYNRLKELAAHVTTINDGLAASAGSLIFMAGDDRKMNAGSNLMIHGAAGFLYGYYQVQDLKKVQKMLEAYNKAGVNIYAERTGRPVEEIKPLVDRETWMTGQDAVDEGFATELIGADTAAPITMKLSPSRSCLMVNGMAVAACCLGNIPETIQEMTAEEWEAVAKIATTTPDNSMQPAPQADINLSENGGTKMEFKTPEELRAAHPDLVAQIETAARAEGATAERNRIQGIEEVQDGIGDAEMVRNAKYGENPMNSDQLIVAAFKAHAAKGTQMLGMMASDTAASGVVAVTATPAPAAEPAPQDKAKAEADAIVNLYKSTKI